MNGPKAVPNELPKYTRWEHERRFAIAPRAPRPWSVSSPWEITDRYLDAGRLRLRAIVDTASGERTYKLCKKFPASSPYSQPIVNVYLSPEEYEGLRGLSGRELRKRRFHERVGALVFGIDVFCDALDGLFLCEIEAPTLDSLMAIEFPSYASVEVTQDAAFTGGALSRTTAAELATLLRGLFRERNRSEVPRP